MANANPYLKEPEKKDEKNAADQLAGAAKNVRKAEKTIGAADAVWKTGASVMAYNAAASTPFVGKELAKGAMHLGAKPLGDAVTNGLGEGVKHTFNFGMLGNVVGGVIATVYVAKAANDFMHGRGAKGAGKIAKGAVLAGTSVLGISGLAIIPDLVVGFVTGKSISERAADAAESGAIHLMGGKSDKKPDKNIKEVNGVNVPATTAVVAGGVAAAGLAANQVMGKDGKPVTIGALPKEGGNVIALPGQPVLPTQVMPVAYSPEKTLEQSQPNMITQETVVAAEPEAYPQAGRSATHWRDKVEAERQQGRAVAQNTAPAASSSPQLANMSKVDIEAARRALAAQNPDLALTGAA